MHILGPCCDPAGLLPVMIFYEGKAIVRRCLTIGRVLASLMIQQSKPSNHQCYVTGGPLPPGLTKWVSKQHHKFFQWTGLRRSKYFWHTTHFNCFDVYQNRFDVLLKLLQYIWWTLGKLELVQLLPPPTHEMVMLREKSAIHSSRYYWQWHCW